jgi:hypothetical protein
VLAVVGGCAPNAATIPIASPAATDGASAPASLRPSPTAPAAPDASPGSPVDPAPAVLGARVAHEAAVSRIPLSIADRAWEPVVATHPTDPNRIAVVHVHAHAGCGTNTVIRISRDGGRTWRSTKGHPGAGSGRGMGIHAAIAWGPGPNGKSRLYWTNMSCGAGGLSPSTAYSDDEGTTWSRLRVERRTPPWVGGFPDIAVDRDPASPNYGTVYVAYNWLASVASAPGFHVLASADFGRTWSAAEVPVAPRPRGYPDSWRIAYRLRPAPDGAVYASWFQADLRHWDRKNIFARGGPANVGRLGVAIARLRFDRTRRTFEVGLSRIAVTVPETVFTTSSGSASGTGGTIRPDPIWQHGFDVDPLTGRLHVAVGTYGSSVGGKPRGSIRLVNSDDGGKTWALTTLPAPARIAGRVQSSFRPNLVAGPDYVLVTFRTLDDVGANATIGTAFTLSTDGGLTWRAPAPISATRWSAQNIAGVTNGIGLRERAERLANGDVFWAYGDGRNAAGSAAGRTAVYGALIHVDR